MYQRFWLVAIAVFYVAFVSTDVVTAQLVEVPLTADDVHSDPGLGSTNLVEYTLNDPFTYVPSDPTSSNPVQSFIGDPPNNYHGDVGNASPSLFYTLNEEIPGAQSFFVDLWGRDSATERDNDFDVILRSGGFDGTISAMRENLVIPDAPEDNYFLRVAFPSFAPFDTIEIKANTQFFTLMEARAGAIDICEPGTCAITGDVNGDMMVDLLDGNIIAQNFYQQVAIGESGDLTIDGRVNFGDFRIWKDIYAPTPQELSQVLGTAAVPEPASAVTAVIAAIALAAVGRTRQRCLADSSC